MCSRALVVLHRKLVKARPVRHIACSSTHDRGETQLVNADDPSLASFNVALDCGVHVADGCKFA